MADRFTDLVAEAAAAPITGWDFGWLAGRATEDRPSWHYFDLVDRRAETATAVLELQVGSGGMLGSLSTMPPLAVGTEGFGPNVDAAAARLRGRGAHLVATQEDRPALPLAAAAFDLVISRHPVDTWWGEIARVLRPGGTYLSQQVGPHSLRDLSEHFLGPLPPGSKRDPDRAAEAADAAGLTVTDLRVEHPQTVFHDIGAVVYFLRLVVWIVPGFDVARHATQLRSLHERIERDGGYQTTASRYLIDATRR